MARMGVTATAETLRSKGGRSRAPLTALRRRGGGGNEALTEKSDVTFIGGAGVGLAQAGLPAPFGHAGRSGLLPNGAKRGLGLAFAISELTLLEAVTACTGLAATAVLPTQTETKSTTIRFIKNCRLV